MNSILRSSGLLLLLLLLVNCSSKATSPAGFLPPAGAVSGWAPTGETQVYHQDNLYDMVDGQADAFFVYGFRQVVTQKYQNEAGEITEIALWELATPADAYGLFTSGLTGQPVSIGNEGDTDPGRRVAFWQDHYWVQVYSRQQLPDADLQALAKAVAERLPAGGEPPPLVNRLPKDTQQERRFIFFHEEISIQNDLWLGGANILGLSQQTDGVLGRCDIDGATAQLLLIQYPEQKAASNGLAALQAGQVEGLVAAGTRDNLLGAVFGQVDQTAGNSLLAKTLGNE